MSKTSVFCQLSDEGGGGGEGVVPGGPLECFTNNKQKSSKLLTKIGNSGKQIFISPSVEFGKETMIFGRLLKSQNLSFSVCLCLSFSLSPSVSFSVCLFLSLWQSLFLRLPQSLLSICFSVSFISVLCCSFTAGHASFFPRYRVNKKFFFFFKWINC